MTEENKPNIIGNLENRKLQDILALTRFQRDQALNALAEVQAEATAIKRELEKFKAMVEETLAKEQAKTKANGPMEEKIPAPRSKKLPLDGNRLSRNEN